MIGIGLSPPAAAGVYLGSGALSPAPTFDPVLIDGDSNTSTSPGVNDNSWAWQWMATRPETIQNRAQSSRAVGTSANLDDAGNTLFGHVAENIAYGPDLVAYMIGSNDWSIDGGTTDAQYRTRLADLKAAYLAASAAVKIAWSPPPPYNPTGTPHAAKAWFDTQRASLMADARDPAVWGLWADYYIPLGEHPDFADAATAAALFGDSVHFSAAGDDLVEAVAEAALGTILDPTRQNSNTLYDAAWLTNETDLAVGATITRRMIVSGLKWTGHSGGVSVTGAGSPSVKVGGVAGPAAWAYNGDVIDLTLTLSGSYETATSVDLTVGGETRTLSFTTAANVTPASYSHGDVVGSADPATSTTLSGLTFADGRAVVMVTTGTGALASDAVKLDDVALTKRHRQVDGYIGCIEIWEGAVAAGSGHEITVAYPASVSRRVVSYGTVANGAFVSATGNATANEDNPHLTPSVTVPAGGIALAGLCEYGGASITPATANTGTTFVDEGNATYQSETLGIAVGTRDTTGSASFNFVFGTFARIIAVFGAA